MRPMMIDYQMRGGIHPDKEKDQIESQIAELAWNNFQNNPAFQRKGLKWTYNYFHFHNIYAAGGPVRDYLFKKRPFPEHIEIEPSTVCDMHCTICENTYMPEKKKLMQYSDFRKIVDQLPDLKQAGLTGIGEAYFNKDFPRMLDYCTERDIVVEIFDTFKDMDRQKAEHIINSSIYKLYCSLDAGTKETYEKIRVGSDWNKVIAGLKLFDKIKKENNANFPELCFHFIINKDNIHEVKTYIQMIADLNIDVSLVQFSRMLHKYKEIEDKFVEIPEELKDQAIKLGEKLGLRVSWNANAAVKKPPFSCCTVWEQPYVFVDGTVTPCCSLNEQNDREWQRKNSPGNVIERPFKEVWEGEKYKQILDSIEKNEIPESCKRCVLCERS